MISGRQWDRMSQAEQWSLDPVGFEEYLTSLSESEQRGLLSSWSFWARPAQRPPEGDYREIFYCTGRGWGKTRTCSEWCYDRVLKGSRAGFLLGRTAEQTRDIQVTGPDGLLAVAERHGTPWEYQSSTAHVITHTKSTWKLHSSEKPDSVRGPSYDSGWIEEFATLKSLVSVDGLTAFDNARFTMRSVIPGLPPQLVMATTPKRVKAVKQMLLESMDPEKKILVVRGSLTDNVANLAEAFTEGILSRYANTALGRQEIDGELATDVEGAIFNSEIFDSTRVTNPDDLPELTRPILAIDPSAGDGTGDECGMVVASVSAGTIPTEMKHGAMTVVKNVRHVYILEDCSMSGNPDVWANKAVEVCEQYDIRVIVAERNQGHEMIRSLLKARNPSLRVELVSATRGKSVRAQPVAGLFSQGRAHLVGEFPEMEDQATTWVPDSGQKSPDRMDACVWAVTYLEPSIGKGDPAPATAPSAFGATVNRVF